MNAKKVLSDTNNIITFFIVDALNINFIDYLCEQKQNNSELE